MNTKSCSWFCCCKEYNNEQVGSPCPPGVNIQYEKEILNKELDNNLNHLLQLRYFPKIYKALWKYILGRLSLI